MAEWIALLEDKAVPCGPINNIAQAFADPQVQARQLRVEQDRFVDAAQAAEHQVVNRIASTASPLRLSEMPATLRYAPPALGQHTAEVLREYLGMTAEQFSALKDKKVLLTYFENSSRREGAMPSPRDPHRALWR